MKGILATLAFGILSLNATAQNTFPLDGNVGIGTTVPGTSLEVATNSVFTDLLRIKNTSNNYPYLTFYRGSTRTSYFGHGGNDQDIYLQSALGSIFLSPNDQIAMALSSNGNVGIGTTTPIQRLDVNGSANVRGSLISSIANANIGGTVQINNPAKTANGAASSWQIFNMSGDYGNSLQFWAYDNLGCAQTNGLCANRFTIMDNGNVGIGISAPDAKLAVNGNIRAKEVKVENTNWPDYVFAKSYQLPTLQETEKHIKEKGHLPGIPSATEVKANGVDLGEMNAKLLQKIEELTLHLIELKKEVDTLKRKP